MLFILDIGNTHIEMGIARNDQLVKSWRVATGLDRTEDEFMVFLEHFLARERVSVREIEEVAISSVVPDMTFIFQKMCEKYLNVEPFLVDHTAKLGIQIRYKNPEAVGADRLCNAVAGYQKSAQAVIIIDFGTATTFDVVNSQGDYLGGIIAPGIETTAWALSHRAAKLPKINLEFPPAVIGRETHHSMQSGIMFGTIKMIEGMVSEIEKELAEPVKVIATGGLTRLIKTKTKAIEAYYPHLVLEGLVAIHKMNR